MVPSTRRTVLKGAVVCASVTALAGCTGPAFSIPVEVTNSTSNRLSTTVSLAEDELLDGETRTWTLDLAASETAEVQLEGGGRPSDVLRLEVDPDGREAVRSTLRNPTAVAIDIEEERIHVTVSKYSDEETETRRVTTGSQ